MLCGGCAVTKTIDSKVYSRPPQREGEISIEERWEEELHREQRGGSEELLNQASCAPGKPGCFAWANNKQGSMDTLDQSAVAGCSKIKKHKATMLTYRETGDNKASYAPYKGQLKLNVYVNSGLLTVHVIAARQLRSGINKKLCNSYVKLSLCPDESKRTRCKTAIGMNTNMPTYDEKFSFELLTGDTRRRLFISVWNKHPTDRQSELLGCMSFGVKHIVEQKKELIQGWYFLLHENIGKRKHLYVREHKLDETSLYMDMKGIDVPGGLHNTSEDSGLDNGEISKPRDPAVKKVHLGTGVVAIADIRRGGDVATPEMFRPASALTIVHQASSEELEALKETIEEQKVAIGMLKEQLIHRPQDILPSPGARPKHYPLGVQGRRTPLPIVSDARRYGSGGRLLVEEEEDDRCPVHDHELSCPMRALSRDDLTELSGDSSDDASSVSVSLSSTEDEEREVMRRPHTPANHLETIAQTQQYIKQMNAQHHESPHSMIPQNGSFGPHQNGPLRNGSIPNGSIPNAPHTNRPHTNGPYTNKPHLNGPLTMGPHTNGAQTKGPHPYGPHTNEPLTNGPHTNGPHTNGPHSNGPHTNGPHTNGPHTNGLHPNGPHENAPHPSSTHRHPETQQNEIPPKNILSKDTYPKDTYPKDTRTDNAISSGPQSNGPIYNRPQSRGPYLQSDSTRSQDFPPNNVQLNGCPLPNRPQSRGPITKDTPLDNINSSALVLNRPQSRGPFDPTGAHPSNLPNRPLSRGPNDATGSRPSNLPTRPPSRGPMDIHTENFPVPTRPLSRGPVESNQNANGPPKNNAQSITNGPSGPNRPAQMVSQATYQHMNGPSSNTIQENGPSSSVPQQKGPHWQVPIQNGPHMNNGPLPHGSQNGPYPSGPLVNRPQGAHTHNPFAPTQNGPHSNGPLLNGPHLNSPPESGPCQTSTPTPPPRQTQQQQQQRQQQHHQQQHHQQQQQQQQSNQDIVEVELLRGDSGYGITLTGDRPARIMAVLPGSPAEHMGVRPRDSILAIDDSNVASLSSDTVARAIRHSEGHMKLRLMRGRGENAAPHTQQQGQATSSASQHQQDRTTRTPALPGQSAPPYVTQPPAAATEAKLPPHHQIIAGQLPQERSRNIPPPLPQERTVIRSPAITSSRPCPPERHESKSSALLHNALNNDSLKHNALGNEVTQNVQRPGSAFPWQQQTLTQKAGQPGSLESHSRTSEGDSLGTSEGDADNSYVDMRAHWAMMKL